MSEEIHSIVFDLSATGEAESINKAAQGLQMSNDNLAEAMRALARRPVALPQQATSAHPAIRALMGAAMMRRGPARYRRPAGIRDRALPPLKPLTADHRVSYTKQAVGSGGRPRGITTQPYSGSHELRARLRGKRDPGPLHSDATREAASDAITGRSPLGGVRSGTDFSRLSPDVRTIAGLDPSSRAQVRMLGMEATAHPGTPPHHRSLVSPSMWRVADRYGVTREGVFSVSREFGIPPNEAANLLIGTRIKAGVQPSLTVTMDQIIQSQPPAGTPSYMDILHDYGTGQ